MWQSKDKIPSEWEYLVKIDKYYHIWYCEFDGVWTVAWIISDIDKWKEIEDNDHFTLFPIFFALILWPIVYDLVLSVLEIVLGEICFY